MFDKMPSGQQVVNMIMETRELIEVCQKDLAQKGKEKARTEELYRVALAQEILRERQKGTPVTIISDVCRGIPKIAKLKYDRDVADALFDIVKSKIFSSQKDMEILKTFYITEYQNSGEKR